MAADSPRPGVGAVLWRLGPMIYGPTVLFSLAEGAIIPLIPVIATHLGAPVAAAALVSSALVVGQLCGNLPAGWAVSRMGERWTMVLGGCLGIAGGVVLLAAPNLVVLTVAVFVIGLCAAVFGLARHAFMTTRVPLTFRARALSMLGGSSRLGVFVGPFIAAGLLGVFGRESAVVWFALACLAGVVLLVLLGPDPEQETARALAQAQTARPPSVTDGSAGADKTAADGVFATMRRHADVLARIGVAAALLSAIRSARQVVLPLWGVSIGVDAQTIAVVVGVSGAVDFALFYVSGQVMDRFGRLWAALPATTVMGAGFLVLAATHDTVRATVWFVACAAVLGLGNGLSSGILMTLGADLAPQADPAAFLGSWRTLTDTGGAAAPLMVSGVTAAASLPAAVAAVGVLAALGAVGFARWIPRYIPRR